MPQQDEINGKTKSVFLLGKDTSYSLSPQIQNKLITEAKVNMRYLPFAVQTKESFSKAIEALIECDHFHGANITNPYKTDIVLLPNILKDKRVQQLQAANTLFKSKEGWKLTNTDVDGIAASVDPFLKRHPQANLLILGAGGAAAAAAFHLLDAHSKINHWCRNPATASSFFSKCNSEHIKEDELEQWFENSKQRSKSGFLVINTLPLGHHSEKNPIAERALKAISDRSGESFFFDMIYNNTESIETAKALNIGNTNGKLMLETQAKQSFQLWKNTL